MVDGTKRNRKFVADFEGKPSRLCIADVMRMGRGAAADEARLLCHKAKVLL